MKYIEQIEKLRVDLSVLLEVSFHVSTLIYMCENLYT